MAFIRYKKVYNKWYVYEVEAYWDKKAQKPRQRVKYLGVADKEGGKYKKPGRIISAKLEKAILDFGDSYVINEIVKKENLQSLIQSSFQNTDTIMSLVCYQLTEGSAMSNCEDWAEGNIATKLFPKAKLVSQKISKLFHHMGKEEIQQKFFQNYIKKFFTNKRGTLIDSTSLPSAINSSINAHGYGSDGLHKNIGCLMLVDKKSKLPMYFRAIPGNITDVSTLEVTIEEIKRLGIKTNSAILDAGYCSATNIEYLCGQKISFITRLPRSNNLFKNLIDQIENIELKANAVQYGERMLFVKTQKIEISDRKLFAHVILDPYKKANDTHGLLKNALEDGTEIDDQMKYCGYFILISKNNIDKKEILPSYYARQAIEQIFSFFKSGNNVLPLRVHSEQSIKGYLMLVFLSLVTFILMRKKLLPHFTVERALLILRGLKAKIYDNEIVVQEPNKKTKEIAKLLNIIMPIVWGI